MVSVQLLSSQVTLWPWMANLKGLHLPSSPNTTRFKPRQLAREVSLTPKETLSSSTLHYPSKKWASAETRWLVPTTNDTSFTILSYLRSWAKTRLRTQHCFTRSKSSTGWPMNTKSYQLMKWWASFPTVPKRPSFKQCKRRRTLMDGQTTIPKKVKCGCLWTLVFSCDERASYGHNFKL